MAVIPRISMLRGVIPVLLGLTLPLLGATSSPTEVGPQPIPAPLDVAPHVDLAAERGNLLLIGGSLGEQRTILNRFVHLADPDRDGPRRALVAVVTASS